MNKNFSTIILSSGLSERMGSPKALLQWDKSTTFIEKLIQEYTEAGSSQIICMINVITEPYCKKMQVPEIVKFVVNEHPEWGRFYSIKTGLSEISVNSYCFIQNVDNPFIKKELIQKIFAHRNQETWCSPEYSGKSGHPVLLNQFIIQNIVEETNLNMTLHDILHPYQKTSVEMDSDVILRNINTPDEYAKYFYLKK